VFATAPLVNGHSCHWLVDRLTCCAPCTSGSFLPSLPASPWPAPACHYSCIQTRLAKISAPVQLFPGFFHSLSRAIKNQHALAQLCPRLKGSVRRESCKCDDGCLFPVMMGALSRHLAGTTAITDGSREHGREVEEKMRRPSTSLVRRREAIGHGHIKPRGASAVCYRHGKVWSRHPAPPPVVVALRYRRIDVSWGRRRAEQAAKRKLLLPRWLLQG
jgi:hypothetical protein